MREILFKAKRKNDGVWVEGLYTTLYPVDKPKKIRKTMHVILPIDSDFNSWNHHLYKIIEIDPETLCQFTGLYDSNDNKIFEGDVLNHHCYGPTIIDRYEQISVWWDVETGGFEPFNDGVYPYDCVVIGNIYDKPELLKEKEK